MVGARAHDRVDVALRLDDHQVDVERLGRRATDGLDDDRAEADVGDEAAVHDVDVDPVGAGGVDGANLFGQSRKIRGQDRWRDDKGTRREGL